MVETSPVARIPGRRPYSLGEEIANNVIHGVGVVLSVVGLTLLVVFAVDSGSGWNLVAGIIYGITLPLDPLIAGTYTPFILVTLRGDGYWWMLSLVWAIALAGIAAEAFWVYRPRWVSVAVYLVMGWLIVLIIEPLARNLDPAAVWLLAAGGLAYTFGTIFYVLKRVPYMHAVWHAFVLAGAVCQFLAVALFVIGGEPA